MTWLDSHEFLHVQWTEGGFRWCSLVFADHCGFNCGFTIRTSVNVALADWLTVGQQAASAALQQRQQQHVQPPPATGLAVDQVLCEAAAAAAAAAAGGGGGGGFEFDLEAIVRIREELNALIKRSVAVRSQQSRPFFKSRPFTFPR